MADSDKSLANLRYNQVTKGLEAFGGGSPQWTPLLLAAEQVALSVVTSSASLGGAANEELLVSGLTTTKTVYAVTQVVPGANNTAMIGFTNDTNGSLKVIWTANPGAGAKVVVVFA